MIDITHKTTTRRVATASARVLLVPDVLARIRDRAIPKGDVFEGAKIAATMAVKNTPALLPYCHPLPVDAVAVECIEESDALLVRVTVTAIHKTGVEMEALAGAAAGALMIYDMVKFTDTPITITDVRLEVKRGGKSDFVDRASRPLRAAVIVLSDTVARGAATDTSGARIAARLAEAGVAVAAREVIPDDAERLRALVLRFCDEERLDLVLTTGGTGLGPRDVTPDVVTPLLEREIPGVMETARAFGQQRMPYAMLSRGVAGMRGATVIATLPGSRGGVDDTLDAILKPLLHIFRMLGGERHE